MTLADIIAKTERGEYHDRQDGPPRFSQMVDDLRAAKVNASAFDLANAAYKGKAAAATFLRNLDQHNG